MRYIHRIDGDPFEVASGECTRWACCGCGLVHDIAFAIEGEDIGIAARVNRRATAAKRRGRGGFRSAVLDNVRAEIREEVAYALELAAVNAT